MYKNIVYGQKTCEQIKIEIFVHIPLSTLYIHWDNARNGCLCLDVSIAFLQFLDFSLALCFLSSHPFGM